MFGYILGSQSAVFKNITISSDQTDWNLITDGFGGVAPSKKTSVTITVNAGVNIVSSFLEAMDLTGLPKDSKITLINNGNIYGKGGNGGNGERRVVEFEPPCFSLKLGMTAGAPGTNAIEYDGTNVNLDITNASGRIWGGGGGGGGGQSCSNISCSSVGGGGGGGGAGGSASAGFGSGGTGGTVIPGSSSQYGDNGSPGTGGPSGAGGSGGAAGSGACTAGAGGAGGAFAVTGASGGFGGAGGGSPGGAVSNNGTGTTTFISGGVQGADIKGVVE